MSGPSPQLPRRPETIDQAIGERIRKFRKSKSMTMVQLGNRVGVRFQQIGKYENGTNRVAASRLWEISEALGVPIRFFYMTAYQVDKDQPAHLGELQRV